MENKINSVKPSSSEITPESIYFSRRDFLKTMGIVSAGAVLAACGPRNNTPVSTVSVESESASTEFSFFDEFGDPANSFQDITNYNNYYQFSTNKEAVAGLSSEFKTRPWTIEVRGLVNKPGIFEIDDLLKIEQKERIYRMRCVESWSMVIPWKGFELGDLLNKVEPQTSAKYIAFTTSLDEDQFPGQGSNFYPWPSYPEGLRLDEAMLRLTILATGLYGKDLPDQNGAPLRLFVPWKYGFKSIKAITKISLVENSPPTLWNTIAPREYGFYSNVNPNVDHPRWSQTRARRIGEYGCRDTMMFNGYESEVASLYSSMDLGLNY